MPYCPKCKVSLGGDAQFCPLCSASSVESLEAEGHPAVSYTEIFRDADEKEKLSPAEKRQILFELLSLSFGMLLIFTVGIDFLFFRDILWSRYTSIILVTLWLFTAIPLVLWNHPALVYAVLGPSLLLGVFLWAVCTGDLSWFFMSGFLITVFIEAAFVSSYVLIAIQKNKGLNAVGVILAFTGLLCAGIDATLHFHFQGSLALTWSPVVILSVLPVAGFFFYLHYRVINRASLRKIFRL